jgi:hypothetical protein
MRPALTTASDEAGANNGKVWTMLSMVTLAMYIVESADTLAAWKLKRTDKLKKVSNERS